jgi:hypothetical protein
MDRLGTVSAFKEPQMKTKLFDSTVIREAQQGMDGVR